MEKYGFIYLWYDKKRKMYYLGCHWGTENDGYVCSSKWMRDAYRYRPQDFKRRILKRNISRENLLEEEYHWLQMINDDEMKVRYYNLSKKHFGHWSNIKEQNKTVREKISESLKGLHKDPVYKQKYLEGRKKLPPQTSEHIQKRANSNKGKIRSEEVRKKLSEVNCGKKRPNGWYQSLSEETRKKHSERMRGEKNPFYGKTHEPETWEQTKKKISQTMKGRKPSNLDNMKHMLIWNNGIINKRSHTCPGDEWTRGRIKKARK